MQTLNCTTGKFILSETKDRITDEKGYTIASTCFKTDEENQANARLMVKSKEMFNILIDTLEWLHNDQGYSVENPYLKDIEKLLESI